MSIRSSFAYRLSLFALVIALLIGSAFSGLQVYRQYVEQNQNLDEHVQRLLQVSRSTATRSVHTLDEALATEVVSGLVTDDFIVQATIVDELGQILANQRRTASSEWVRQVGEFFPEPLKVYSIRIDVNAIGAPAQGELSLHVNRLEALAPFFQRVSVTFASDMLRYLLLAILLFFVFHSRLTRPLNRLVREIDRIDPSHPEYNRIMVPAAHEGNELGKIGSAVNRTLELVDELMSETRQQQKSLIENDRHKHQIINAVPHMVFATDNGCIVFANLATAEFLGTSLERVEGRHLRDFIPRLGRDLVEMALQDDIDVLETGEDKLRDDIVVRHAGGEEKIVSIHRLPLENRGRTIVLNVATDVTEQKRVQKQIRHQAYHDSLTDLPNRAFLLETLQRELDRSRRHSYVGAVLFIDLDHFKKINDSLGHPVGDVILQNVAQRLLRSCRSEDTISRLGGDEFVIVLPELDRTLESAAERAMDVAEKVRHTLSQPVEVNEQFLNVTCSIGIAMFPENNVDVHALLRYADTAMYHAKGEGRDAIEFFSQNMASRVNRHLELENQLRLAIEQEQFVLYFQPQVDCMNNRIVGAEILLRWNHPEMGLVPPAEFIPILESSRLIIPVGFWIMKSAFRQVTAWQKAGIWQHDWRLGINISPRQFRDKTFVDDVKALIAQTGVNPSLIEFEITESIVIHNLDEAVETMNRLRLLGISFSLDDFGTGYSSLGYLKVLPVEAIKIDRTFVRDMCEDSHDAAIIDATLALSHRIGLSVVAEGVEQENQLHQLRELRCQSYQGFLFSRPVPADAFAALALRVAPPISEARN